MKEFEEVKKMLLDSGLSNRKLAKKIGINWAIVCRIRNGKHTSISLKTYSKIMEALNAG